MQKSKKKQTQVPQKLNRSRSKSRNPAQLHLQIKHNQKKMPKSSRDKIKSKAPPAQLNKSQSKNKLNKSQSDKKLNRSSSLPRISSSPNTKIPTKKFSVAIKPTKNPTNPKINPNPKPQKPIPTQPPPNNTLKSQQKQMGLFFMKPQFDKINFKPLQPIDPVYDRYLQMINNDNDASYMMNALPQLRSFKKQDDTQSRDFVSGRVSRLSGMFQNLTVDKIITAMKKVPNYYAGQCGKNLTSLRILLQTKFKVEVDIGFLQYSLDGDKLTLFRIYLSKIYRRMNYIGYVYLQAFKALMQRHPGAQRFSIFILERNLNIHKFFKYLGFHIENVASESKNKTVDYFQEMAIKKKEMSTVISSMGK